MRTPARTTPVVLLIAAAALAACGGEDQDAGSTPATPTVTVTETATETATATATVTETVTETPGPTDSPRPRGCGQVAFEPNTDAGAFDIRAADVECRVAREVARGAEGEGGERYAASEGFDCRPTGTVGELPSVLYECTRDAGGRITFLAS